MSETMAFTPFRVNNLHTYIILLLWVSLSSLLKPRPLLRFLRTLSPSKSSTFSLLAFSSRSTFWAIVVFPEPGRPVSQTTKPCSVFIDYASSTTLPSMSSGIGIPMTLRTVGAKSSRVISSSFTPPILCVGS